MRSVHFMSAALLLCASALPAHAQAPAGELTPEQLVGRLAQGETSFIKVNLQRGEYLRTTIMADSGALRGRLLDARRQPLQVTWAWSFFGVSLPLAMEAPHTGVYYIELSVPPSSLPWVKTAAYHVQMYRESAGARASLRRELLRDPRVAYLRSNAQRVRSISPADTNYADLEWLREPLQDVDVVMFGEGDHGGGSDLLAQTRLIQFLHQQMGYDLVVFESGIHSTNAAWRGLQANENPRDAFLKGVFTVWGAAEQATWLINYLASHVHGDRPLALAGIDCQLSGTAAGALLTDLQQFLAGRGVVTPLADDRSLPARLLGRLMRGEYRDRDSLPPPADQAEAVEAMRATATELDGRKDDRDAAFWAQVLRSTALQLDGQMNMIRGVWSQLDYMAARDHQMTQNLFFLVNRMYPGRKAIVVAHTAHVMRSPQSTNEGRARGFTMGQGVWEVLGRRSFTVAFTSYNGTTHWVTQPDDISQDVIPAQHSLFEFEGLMNAAALRAAFVNLRTPGRNGAWLRGRFTASAIYLAPQEADWGSAVDGLFFIRTQVPRRKPRGATSRRLSSTTTGGHEDSRVLAGRSVGRALLQRH